MKTAAKKHGDLSAEWLSHRLQDEVPKRSTSLPFIVAPAASLLFVFTKLIIITPRTHATGERGHLRNLYTSLKKRFRRENKSATIIPDEELNVLNRKWTIWQHKKSERPTYLGLMCALLFKHIINQKVRSLL